MTDRRTFDGALIPDEFHMDVTRAEDGRFKFRTRNRTNYGVSLMLSKESVEALAEFLTSEPMPEEPTKVGTVVDVDGKRYMRQGSRIYPWAGAEKGVFNWADIVTPDSTVKVVA